MQQYRDEYCSDCGHRACRTQRIQRLIPVCPYAPEGEVICPEVGCCHGCDCFDECDGCECDCHLKILGVPDCGDDDDDDDDVVAMVVEPATTCQCVPCVKMVALSVYESSDGDGDFNFVINRPPDCWAYRALQPNVVSSYYDNSDGRNRSMYEFVTVVNK